MKFNRKYVHKRFGEIAEIEIEFPDTGWAINGTTLPERAVRHLVNHATQSLLDSYAGAKTRDQAIGMFDKKFDRILGGEIGIRASGQRDPLRTMAIRLAELGMTGGTAKVRHEKAVALVDSTDRETGYWWNLAATTIAAASQGAPAEDVELPDEVDDDEEVDEDEDEIEAVA